MPEKIPGLSRLRELIGQSENIVFFGGAGVSTESGIPDFRSQDGLYRQEWDYPPEEIVSHSFFTQKTQEFYRFYRQKMLWLEAEPNAAHRGLARLEREGKLLSVVTQNIDGLHQAAGSRRVWELHGSVHRNRCLACGREFSVRFVKEAQGIPRCPCGGIVKPEVVLYEEGLDSAVLQGAAEDIAQAGLLIIGGTSLGVYPAAGLINYYRGEELVVINRSPTPRDAQATLLLTAPIGEVFQALWEGERAAAVRAYLEANLPESYTASPLFALKIQEKEKTCSAEILLDMLADGSRYAAFGEDDDMMLAELEADYLLSIVLKDLPAPTDLLLRMRFEKEEIRVERKWGSRLGTLTYGTARMTVSFEEE